MFFAPFFAWADIRRTNILIAKMDTVIGELILIFHAQLVCVALIPPKHLQPFSCKILATDNWCVRAET